MHIIKAMSCSSYHFLESFRLPEVSLKQALLDFLFFFTAALAIRTQGPACARQALCHWVSSQPDILNKNKQADGGGR